jgi:hypothetical protein
MATLHVVNIDMAALGSVYSTTVRQMIVYTVQLVGPSRTGVVGPSRMGLRNSAHGGTAAGVPVAPVQ